MWRDRGRGLNYEPEAPHVMQLGKKAGLALPSPSALRDRDSLALPSLLAWRHTARRLEEEPKGTV